MGRMVTVNASKVRRWGGEAVGSPPDSRQGARNSAGGVRLAQAAQLQLVQGKSGGEPKYALKGAHTRHAAHKEPEGDIHEDGIRLQLVPRARPARRDRRGGQVAARQRRRRVAS